MKEKKINEILHNLVVTNSSIEGVALVTSDGLMISSHLPGNMDEDRISAVSAALLSLSERVVEEVEKGVPEQVTIKGSEGYIVLTSAGEEAVLTVTASNSAKLGLLYLDIKKAATELKKVFAV